MTTSDIIQLAILAVLAATLTAVFRQLMIHNRLLQAQILRDRFDMYWKTYEPVSDADMEELRLVPDDYMNLQKYETTYKNNPTALRKYVSLLQTYEYLAFCFLLKRLQLPDPLGYAWTEKWATDLLEHKEFVDVHQHQKKYYPEFAEFIARAIRKRESQDPQTGRT